jgi:hypothetical protein
MAIGHARKYMFETRKNNKHDGDEINDMLNELIN